nr:pentatricopeptide repeat-containing protein [Tanacetum cinerariifolium]
MELEEEDVGLRCSSSTTFATRFKRKGTNTKGKAHYGLRSLGPLKEEIVHVKKPYSMMKVSNVVLRYVNGSVSCVSTFTHDKDVFSRCLDHIMSDIDEHKWALFYRIPKKSHDKGLKLLHTDNDVHLFFDAAVKNGSIHLYVAHKKQNLRKYYYKNMEREEEDADLRCSNSTRFTIRFKRKIIKSNMIGLRKKVKACVIHDDGADRKRKKTVVNGGNKGKEKLFENEDADRKTKKTLVNGGNKGKEKLFEDEGMCSKRNKAAVTIYKGVMVNGKAKMVKDVGAVKTGRDRGVVIRGGGFNNVGGKE